MLYLNLLIIKVIHEREKEKNIEECKLYKVKSLPHLTVPFEDIQ
jgi:hypothetical protein